MKKSFGDRDIAGERVSDLENSIISIIQKERQ